MSTLSSSLRPGKCSCILALLGAWIIDRLTGWLIIATKYQFIPCCLAKLYFIRRISNGLIESGNL